MTGVLVWNDYLPYDRHLAGPTIGGELVLDLLEDHDENVVLVLAYGGDQTLYVGEIEAVSGLRGYGPQTPGEPPVIKVGGRDVLELMEELDGQLVHLRMEVG